MIIWSEKATLVAADNASRLSDLLEQDGFLEQDAFRWVSTHHLHRFLSAIDAAEAERLMRSAAAWDYDDESDTHGFPLLDWLWVIDPHYSLKPQELKTTRRVGSAGWELVARLAELHSDWVGRWWSWRCANRRDEFRQKRSHYDNSIALAVDKAVLDALITSDVASRLSALNQSI